jgi:hypothetical protein
MFMSESKDIINILMYKEKGLSLDLIKILRHTKQVWLSKCMLPKIVAYMKNLPNLFELGHFKC